MTILALYSYAEEGSMETQLAYRKKKFMNALKFLKLFLK